MRLGFPALLNSPYAPIPVTSTHHPPITFLPITPVETAEPEGVTTVTQGLKPTVNPSSYGQDPLYRVGARYRRIEG